MARQQHKSTGEKSQPDAAAPSADTAPLLGRRRLLRLGVLLLLLAALIWKRDAWLPQLVHPRVRAALADRQPDVALKWLDRLDTVVDGDPESAFLRARAYRKQGDMEQVRVWLQKALDRGLDPERVRREEWLAYAQSGQMQQAERHFTQLMLDPRGDSAEICEAFVTGYLRTGLDAAALGVLDTWIADHPEDQRPLILKGQLLLRDGSYARAAQQLRAAATLDPDNPELAISLGKALLARQQHEDAMQQFQMAMHDSTTAVDARLGAAAAHIALGQNEQASHLYQQVLEEIPNQFDALAGLGQIKLDAGESSEAVPLLNAAVALNPRSTDVRYALAQALQAEGRNEEARSQLDWVESARKAVEEITNLRDDLPSNPDDLAARYRIATLEYEFVSPDEAVLMFASILAYDPDHGPTHAALARHYFEKAESDPELLPKAREHAKKAQTAGIRLDTE
ncbi:MAG: hypothetical protein DWQ41_00325 [Planctomycetota bacterium]|nr:MAG: hypothetical protein DWQ41_00325 [Planctomycetota bacterium]